MISSPLPVKKIFYIFCSILSVVAAFAVVYRFTLSHFYYGAFLFDAGWYSDLIYRNPLQINAKSLIYPGNFFNYHFSPIFQFFSLLSYLIPFSEWQWFSVFQGFHFSILSLTGCLLIQTKSKLHWILVGIMSISGGLFFAFNGIALSCLIYPHNEVLIPASISLFILLLFLGHYKLAALPVFFALISREDAGFHMTAIVFFLWLWNLKQTPKKWDQRILIRYGLVAFSYSILACLAQRLFFDYQSLLVHTFIGSPPWGHITLPLLYQRLLYLFSDCQYLVYPFVLAVCSAIVFRSWLFIAGYFAYIPWVLLLVFGTMNIDFFFGLYYAFPLTVGIFMSMISCFYIHGSNQNKKIKLQYISACLCVLFPFSSLVGVYMKSPDSLSLVASRVIHSAPTDEKKLRSFMEVFEQPKTIHGLCASESVIALRPSLFTFAQRVDQKETDSCLTVITMIGAYDANKSYDVIRKNGLKYFYAVPETIIGIASKDPLPSDSPLIPHVMQLDHVVLE